MSGTYAGGKAASIANKKKDAAYLKKYGMTFYQYIGSMGGKASGTGGFWHTKYVKGNIEAIRAAGALGGSRSKR